MKRSLLPLLACPKCRGILEADSDGGAGAEILEGVLRCRSCQYLFVVHGGVPVLLDSPTAAEVKTGALYGDLWKSFSAPRRRPAPGYNAPARSHLELLRLASGCDIVRGSAGIDAGCGSGGNVIELADRHPDVTILGIDISDGVALCAGAAQARPNAHLLQGNLLAPPIARSSFDFVYSFGVLHHTRNPECAFRNLLECLRPGGRITVFLYKDFSDLPFKRLLLIPVTLLRRVTTRLPPGVNRVLAWGFAPLVYATLTLPSRLLRRLGAGRLARHIPYTTFPDVSSVASSLEDRFGAPFEFRYSRRDLEKWSRDAGLEDARVVDCLPFGFSGLVLTGVKCDDRKPEGTGDRGRRSNG